MVSSDRNENKDQSSTADRYNNKKQASNRFAGSLSSFERTVAILASIWRQSRASTAERDKNKE